MLLQQRIIGVFVVTTAIAIIAHADCPAGAPLQVTGTIGGFVDECVFDSATSKWQVTVRTADPVADIGIVDFDILGDETVNIAYIRIVTDSDAPVGLFVHDPSSPSLPIGSIDLIERVATPSHQLTEVVTVSFIIKGDVGDIRITDLIDFQVDGNVTGTIDMLDKANGTLTGSNIGVTGFGTIKVTGNVLGNILVPFGFIKDLVVQGSLGDPSAPAGARSNVTARDGVQFLRASEINADIDTTSSGLASGVGVIDATTDFGGTGDFNGSLKAASMHQFGATAPEIRVAGKLTGTITIDEALDAPVTILADQGMTGQIIINGANAGSTWTAPVTIGSVSGPGPIVLDPALFANGAYPDTPATLGGGSVGLAPFNQHMQASLPVKDGTITDDASALNSVRMRFYGPVEIDTSNPQLDPVLIERSPTTGGAWSTLDPSSFTIAVDTSADPLGDTLVITENTTNGFAGDFTYRIRPTSALRSSGVAGVNNVVIPTDIDAYMFSVTPAPGGGGPPGPTVGCELPNPPDDPDCPPICPVCIRCLLNCAGSNGVLIGPGPDFNMNGVVGDFDLKVMLQAQGVQGGKADLNYDGIVNAADLDALLKVYGAPVVAKQ